MASNNRVEVHIGANTSDLKSGMKDSESIVNKTAKEIENTGKATTFKVDLSGMERSFEQASKNIQSNMQHLSTNVSNTFNQSFASITSSLKMFSGVFAGLITIDSVSGMADGYVQMAAQIRNAAVDTMAKRNECRV